jgi:nicotinamidase-related amidase
MPLSENQNLEKDQYPCKIIAMKKAGLPNRNTTALLVIDVQERLMPVINASEAIFSNVNKLLSGAAILGISTIVTEQYPKGLGHTCSEIQLPENVSIDEKMCFSCMRSDSVLSKLKQSNITDIIICGVESHICVLKTTLEAIEQGFNVHIVQDAVSSRSIENKGIAIERMRQSGAYIVSTEMMLFMLIDEAGTEEFKAISKLIK